MPPSTKLFAGDGFRKLWNAIQELKVARTRDWIPGMSDEDVKVAQAKIDEYVQVIL